MSANLSLLNISSARGLLARYSKCTRGATAIEFAFVAPAIIAIMLAAIQISTIWVAQSYLEAVTEKAMRIALTNQTYTLSASDFKTQLCSNVNALFSCSGLMVDMQPINDCSGTGAALTTCLNKYQPQIDPATGALKNLPVFKSGASNDKMRLLVMYQWPVIGGPLGMSLSSTGNRLLSAVQIFYKEPCLDTLTSCAAVNG